MSDAINAIRRQYAGRLSQRNGSDWTSSGYGPFRFAAPAGWLLLASTFRVFASNGIIPAFFCANVLVLLAAVDSTRKIVEGMQGRTSLDGVSFTDLLRLALMTGRRLLPLIIMGLLVGVGLDVARIAGPSLTIGAAFCIDGIAFDTDGIVGPACSAVAGLLIFMIIVAHGTGLDTRLPAVASEIVRRRHHLLPALLMALAMLAVVGVLQDWVREPVYRAVMALDIRTMAGSATFYAFVAGFAAVRLSLLIFIFTAALRRSYAEIR